MKIEATQNITDKEGYEAMLMMLDYYLNLTGSTDLTDILSGGEYIGQESTPADPSFWYYWLEAVEKIKNKKTPLRKQITPLD
jgi:hypothetical protein